MPLIFLHCIVSSRWVDMVHGRRAEGKKLSLGVGGKAKAGQATKIVSRGGG